MSLDGLRVQHARLDTAAGVARQVLAEVDLACSRFRAIREMRDLLGETSRAVQESNAEYQAADRRGAASFEG